MLTNKQVMGENGPIDLPQLDGFINCIHGVKVGKETIYLSEGFAYERHIDDYLKEYEKYFFKVARFAGVSKAHNLIHTARCNKNRNRLEAAKYIASLAKDHLIVKKALKKDNIYLDYDSYQPTQAWIWRKDKFTGVCIDVREGKMWLGEGDGYHRETEYGCVDGDTWTDEDGKDHITQSYDIKNEDLIRKAVKKEINSKKYVGGCDEKYSRNYQEIKSKLKKRK